MLTNERRIELLKEKQARAAARLENAKAQGFSPYVIRTLENALIVRASDVAMAEALAIIDGRA